ncbi:MAG: hypothetical protein LQ343_001467 [Gyalolechia ehrenbergii]|nr:MAG: hypothetical protein LQ343_001467 [Gyalolechia ehrenbergii]
MVVCKFFLEGRCKFGDSCKNEHPGRITTGTRNPFTPLQNNSRQNPSGQGAFNKGSKSADYPYHLDKDIISKDLTNERPLYILSSYGPGRDAPQQLFGGQPREQSFEELRLRHHELASAGNEAQAIQEAQALYNNAEQQIQKALSDLDGALRYITDAANQHPNRLDICRAKGGDISQPQQPSGIVQPGVAPSTGGPTFGQPSFGKPSVPAFGKPSFGQSAAPASVFGQSAPLNQKRTVFGQSSEVNPGLAFGQPAELGQKPTSFGQVSNPNSAPAFGQTSTPPPFGQPQQAAKPFGVQQPQPPPAFGQGPTPSPFGQSQQAAKPSGIQEPPKQPTFGQPSFGKPSFTAPQASGIFGQQQAPAPSNPFAKAPTTPSAFGQSTAAPTNQTSTFEVPQPSNAFGKTSATQAAANPFGQKGQGQNLGTFGQPTQPAAPAFGQPAAPSSTGIFGNPTVKPSVQAPATPPTALAPQASKAAPTNAKFETDREGNRRLLNWQGKKVTYVGEDPCFKNARDGGWEKIWFPEGPPSFKNTQEYPDGYVPDEAAIENLKHFLQHGVGLDGLIPDIPPPRDMITWNF